MLSVTLQDSFRMDERFLPVEGKPNPTRLAFLCCGRQGLLVLLGSLLFGASVMALSGAHCLTCEVVHASVAGSVKDHRSTVSISV